MLIACSSVCLLIIQPRVGTCFCLSLSQLNLWSLLNRFPNVSSLLSWFGFESPKGPQTFFSHGPSSASHAMPPRFLYATDKGLLDILEVEMIALELLDENHNVDHEPSFSFALLPPGSVLWIACSTLDLGWSQALCRVSAECSRGQCGNARESSLSSLKDLAFFFFF